MRKPSKKAAAATAALALAAASELTIGMSTEAVINTETGDAALDALMAELNDVAVPLLGDDEVLLAADPSEFEVEIEAGSIGHEHPSDSLLADAVSGAEMLESYDTDAEAAASDAVAPKAADPAVAKEKKAKAPKAAKAPKEPKPAKEPKTFYGLDRVKRLTDRGVAAVMLKSEESLTGDDLSAAQQRTLDVVANSNQKVKNRTSNVLEFVTGKTAVLNNLIRVCFNLIEKDGILVTGEKGNMWATMSTCYGAGTIRSGGNNSVAALRDLQVILSTPAGYVKNPDSAIYERIALRLGAVEAGDAVETAETAVAEVPADVVEETPAEEVAETSSEEVEAAA